MSEKEILDKILYIVTEKECGPMDALIEILDLIIKNVKRERMDEKELFKDIIKFLQEKGIIEYELVLDHYYKEFSKDRETELSRTKIWSDERIKELFGEGIINIGNLPDEKEKEQFVCNECKEEFSPWCDEESYPITYKWYTEICIECHMKEKEQERRKDELIDKYCNFHCDCCGDKIEFPKFWCNICYSEIEELRKEKEAGKE